MKNTNSTKRSDKNKLICLILFVVESIIIISCYLLESSGWHFSAFIPTLEMKLFISGSLVIILLASLFLCLFIKRLSLDKKILIMLGFIAISLGIIGTSGLVFEKEISFVDAVYKTFQLFVGEFGELSYEVGTFPVMLNISRFLALFVTFGAIIIILLREKLYYLSIRLFYKDVVIISDSLDQRINSLREKLAFEGRKVIIGLVTNLPPVNFKSDEDMPVIRINLEKSLFEDLKHCNIKKSKNIYLFCSKTSVNMQLFRHIQPLFINNSITKQPKLNLNNSSIKKNELPVLVENFLDLLKHDNKPSSFSKTTKNKKTICYIQYQTDSERDYYSLDDSLIIRSDSFETYFINIDDTAVRQMISELSLWNLSGTNGSDSTKDIISKLQNIKIGISGSGKLLERVLYEISRLCIFNNNIPIHIYHLKDKINNTAIEPPSKMNDIVKIKEINISNLKKANPRLDLLFVCSSNEIEIRSIVHSVLQYGFYSNMSEIIILSKSNQSEFQILKKFVSTIASSFLNNQHCDSNLANCSTIRLANTIDLVLSIDEFYKNYGPTSREIHKAYKKAMENGILIDFNKLPEVFTESNILNSIHNKLILDFLRELEKHSTAESEKSNIDFSLLEFFAITEHERWFNERLLQGYIYSDEQNYLLNRNSYLLHWKDLDEAKRSSNIRYVINSFTSQLKKRISDKPFENSDSSLILQYKININEKEKNHEI